MTASERLAFRLSLETYLTNREWILVERNLGQRYGRVKMHFAKSRIVRWATRSLAPMFEARTLANRVPTSLLFTRRHRRNTVRYPDFVRLGHTRSHSLFAHPGNVNRSLLILWTGKRRVPMMPLSIFLEYVRPFGCDVLVLRPSSEHGYSRGITGLGTNILETMSSITNLIHKRGYQNVFCQGTSMGTYPALQSIGLPYLRSIFLAGPVDPIKVDPSEYKEFLSRISGARKFPKITIGLGSNAERDHEAANEIDRHFPTDKFITKNTGHNPIWKPIQLGKPNRWLRDILDIPAPASRSSGRTSVSSG